MKRIYITVEVKPEGYSKPIRCTFMNRINWNDYAIKMVREILNLPDNSKIDSVQLLPESVKTQPVLLASAT